MPKFKSLAFTKRTFIGGRIVKSKMRKAQFSSNAADLDVPVPLPGPSTDIHPPESVPGFEGKFIHGKMYPRRMSLLSDVHTSLPSPEEGGESFLVKGSYLYYHYACDGFKDEGWGCGYRTLQSLCSHIRIAKETAEKEESKAKHCSGDEPSLKEIQEALVAMQDKPESFVGSREWIGSFEVSLCLDYFHDVSGKIIHLNSGSDIPGVVPDLVKHFKTLGSPIMMGGDSDASSKGIFGVYLGTEHSYLLVIDPHFTGHATAEELIDKEWVSWKRSDSFMVSSFYNLCLPQFCSVTKR